MKLTHSQLIPHLTKQLASLYLVCSDEILLAQEAVDSIREAARRAGFNERVLTTVDSGSDWGKYIYEDTHSLSLFGTKKIIELNLMHIKLSAANSKTLEEYASKPPTDTVLIVQTGKLDTKTEKTLWFQAIEKKSVFIPIWPITPEELPQWIMQRAKKSHLTMTKQAAEQFANLVEGNLLAAATEIEKLGLLQTTTELNEKTIEAMITDYARFDIFQLVDSTLKGNSERSLRILQSLAEEDTEPTLILWALTRELRMLAEIQQQLAQGNTLSSLFNKLRIWEKRQPGVRAFLQRHKQTDSWKLLINAAKIDRIIKGAETGNVWNELQDLSIRMTKNVII